VLLLPIGVALIAIATVDAIWTTLSTKDAGPISGWVAGHLWFGLRRAHGASRSHRLLSAGGTIIVLATLLTWLFFFWAGWTLVFASSHEAIVDLQTREPVDFVGRIYFAGYAMTTLGTGDVVPVGGWRIVTILCAASGLVIITLAITYFGPLLGAVTAGRQVATYIASMGTTPQQLIIKAWHEGDLRGLDSYLANLAEMLNSHTQRHHAYPVVHYFHTSDPESAVPLRLAVLDEAITLMRVAVTPEARPHPMSLHVLESATTAYLNILSAVYIDRAEDAPPLPDLAPLREAGIPLLPEEQIQAAFESRAARRQLLLGLVEHDGWSWADVPLDREGGVRTLQEP